MFKAHLSAFFAKVSPAVYHLRFCLSWNRDIFFLGRPFPADSGSCPNLSLHLTFKHTILSFCPSHRLSTPHHLSRHLHYPFIKFLSSCPPSPSCIPQVLSARLKMFFKDSSPVQLMQESHCVVKV